MSISTHEVGLNPTQPYPANMNDNSDVKPLMVGVFS